MLLSSAVTLTLPQFRRIYLVSLHSTLYSGDGRQQPLTLLLIFSLRFTFLAALVSFEFCVHTFSGRRLPDATRDTYGPAVTLTLPYPEANFLMLPRVMRYNSSIVALHMSAIMAGSHTLQTVLNLNSNGRQRPQALSESLSICHDLQLCYDSILIR
jgi:hypothetical protein